MESTPGLVGMPLATLPQRDRDGSQGVDALLFSTCTLSRDRNFAANETHDTPRSAALIRHW